VNRLQQLGIGARKAIYEHRILALCPDNRRGAG
jgi:hypothetical protein